jgi:hypothetical protein
LAGRTFYEAQEAYATADFGEATSRGCGVESRAHIRRDRAPVGGQRADAASPGSNQYGGMKGPEVARLKELERENARLKKIVAEQAMDIDVLKDLSRKKW